MLKLDGIAFRPTQGAHGHRVVVTVSLREAPQLDRREIEQLVTDVQWDQPDEFAFGDYEPGRWAWHLRDVQALDVAVPWTGRHPRRAC